MLICIGVIGWIWLEARADYHWANDMISDASSEGWVVSATSDNYVVPTHPWTIFKQPISSVWFIKPERVWKLENGLIVASELHFNYDGMERTEKEFSTVIIDCKNKKHAFTNEIRTIGELNMKNLLWGDIKPHSPGEQTYNKLCK